MKGICQVAALILTFQAGIETFANESFGAGPLPGNGGNECPCQVAPIPARSFRALRWEEPELFACLVLLGGEIPVPQNRTRSMDQQRLSQALGRQIRAVAEAPPPDLTLFYGYRAQPTPTGVAFGKTVLLVLPQEPALEPEEAARTAVVAWLVAQKQPTPPQSGVSEPLLLLAEGLVWQGSFALANTPPELLPVSQWLEPKQVFPPLEALVREVFDNDTPYRAKRARLRGLQGPGGGDPPLARAAAYLLEAFGSPERARMAPLELLQAWEKNSEKRFPPMPKALKRALRGVAFPKGEKEDLELLALDTSLRAAETTPPDQALPENAPPEARAIWLARRRAVGLPTEAPRGIDPKEGYLLSRPENGEFAVYWRQGARELLLFLWPRWVMSPRLAAGGQEVVFVDPVGVWRVSLAGEGVEKVLGGSFRAVALSSSGIAALSWPTQELRLALSGPSLAHAKGGATWVGNDLLLVSDGENLQVVDLQGEAEPLMALPCCAQLAGSPPEVWAITGSPCEPALLRLDLSQRQAIPVLSLPETPADFLPLPRGQLLLLTSQGVLSVKEGQVQRQTVAFALGGG